MTSPTYPTVDESLDRLHRAGWSVGDDAFGPAHALTWLVTGHNGENVVEAWGSTRAEAPGTAGAELRNADRVKEI